MLQLDLLGECWINMLFERQAGFHPITFILFTFFVSVSSPASAQFDCSRISVQSCPSLFEEECRNRDFQTANIDACFDALTGSKPDEAFCADPAVGTCKPSEECAKIDSPVKRHFCAAGQSSCKTKVPYILDDYNLVLARLEESLAKYNNLTNLNLDEANSIKKLCEYQIDQLNSLQSQAETELTAFESSENGISQIDQCASTMQSYLDAGAPRDLPQETWDQIVNALVDGMGEIQSKQGQIQTRIEALRSAPDKLRSLKYAYEVICPEPADN